MKKRYFYWAFAVILVIFLTGRHFYRTQKAVGFEEGDTEVRVAPLKSQEVTVEKNYIGYVTPINDVVVKPYINGFVKEIKVVGGQKVKAGDELVVLEQGEYRAILDSAIASVAKCEADLDYAEKYYQRVEKSGKKAFSQNDIDEAKANYLSAKASLLQAKAAVAQAEVNFDYTYIKATIDGVVGNVGLSEGDYVSPQSELFTIVQTSPIRVVFSMSDKDFLEESSKVDMFAGEEIKLKLVNGNTYEYAGKFEYADNKIDRSTNAVAVYANFENPKNLLMDNAYVTVLLEKKYEAILLNKEYVNLSPNENFVYVVEDDTVKKHKVNILAEKQNLYVLENDFEPKMQLLTSKIVFGGENQKVKVVEEDK
ncbi:MAG: efflux RND transporter periplasmic adaptor subunit [Alphaproteobacteria bacterium]|nr:efflux RND transporter periplasmic adaptor subunit [Alphaproteobacteria bacterium]